MSNVVNSKVDKYDVYIGRPSKWGNPFSMKLESDRDFVVLKHKLWLNTRPDLLRSLGELKDKKLGCFCAPKSCHGDTLTDLASSRWIKNWFSNMLPFDQPLEEDGIKYKSPENYYQAMKMGDMKCRHDISYMSPFEAKKAIRNKSQFPWRSDWTKEMSIEVMRTAIAHKFQPETSWGKMLLMTEDWEITEWNNWGDTKFGKCINSGKGENLLGKILMEQRNELRRTSS